MSGLDREARTSRFLDAFDCVYDLLACRVPGMQVDAEHLAQLLGMIRDEARLVIQPVRYAANDSEEME